MTNISSKEGWSLLELLAVMAVVSALILAGFMNWPRGQPLDLQIVHLFQEARLEAFERQAGLSLEIQPVGKSQTCIQTGCALLLDGPLGIQTVHGEPLYDAEHLRVPFSVHFGPEGHPDPPLLVSRPPHLRFLLLSTGALVLETSSKRAPAIGGPQNKEG